MKMIPKPICANQLITFLDVVAEEINEVFNLCAADFGAEIRLVAVLSVGFEIFSVLETT